MAVKFGAAPGLSGRLRRCDPPVTQPVPRLGAAPEQRRERDG